MLRLVCHNPSGVNGLIVICSVRIFVVLNISHVSNRGQSTYLETKTGIFTFSTCTVCHLIYKL